VSSRPSQPVPEKSSTVRDGQIVASRDYHNHLILAEVLGQLPTLIAALAREEPA
jgi:hypothetical protein